MKEYIIDKSSFIGGWYIPENICDEIILTYKKNKSKVREGECVYDNVRSINKDIKESFDINVNASNFDPPFNEYRKYLQECLEKYLEKYPDANRAGSFNINTEYNIQYYPPGGGYKTWHHESANKETSVRNLVFMTYLNDAKSAGTEFKYQQITTPCKKGLTLIWPTAFTHTHRGENSKDEEKYIVTGWYTYT